MEESDKSEEITKIETRINTLEEKIDLIIQKMDKISVDTTRMDSHITFIEDVYEKIKSPFLFLMKKTESLQESAKAFAIR